MGVNKLDTEIEWVLALKCLKTIVQKVNTQ